MQRPGGADGSDLAADWDDGVRAGDGLGGGREVWEEMRCVCIRGVDDVAAGDGSAWGYHDPATVADVVVRSGMGDNPRHGCACVEMEIE
jgi:hypothetical protein